MAGLGPPLLSVNVWQVTHDALMIPLPNRDEGVFWKLVMKPAVVMLHRISAAVTATSLRFQFLRGRGTRRQGCWEGGDERHVSFSFHWA